MKNSPFSCSLTPVHVLVAWMGNLDSFSIIAVLQNWWRAQTSEKGHLGRFIYYHLHKKRQTRQSLCFTPTNSSSKENIFIFFVQIKKYLEKTNFIGDTLILALPLVALDTATSRGWRMPWCKAHSAKRCDLVNMHPADRRGQVRYSR